MYKISEHIVHQTREAQHANHFFSSKFQRKKKRKCFLVFLSLMNLYTNKFKHTILHMDACMSVYLLSKQSQEIG